MNRLKTDKDLMLEYDLTVNSDPEYLDCDQWNWQSMLDEQREQEERSYCEQTQTR